jgi:hypothetical protein
MPSRSNAGLLGVLAGDGAGWRVNPGIRGPIDSGDPSMMDLSWSLKRSETTARKDSKFAIGMIGGAV